MKKVVCMAGKLVILLVSVPPFRTQEERAGTEAARLDNKGALTLGVEDSAAESSKRLQVNVRARIRWRGLPTWSASRSSTAAHGRRRLEGYRAQR